MYISAVLYGFGSVGLGKYQPMINYSLLTAATIFSNKEFFNSFINANFIASLAVNAFSIAFYQSESNKVTIDSMIQNSKNNIKASNNSKIAKFFLKATFNTAVAVAGTDDLQKMVDVEKAKYLLEENRIIREAVWEFGANIVSRIMHDFIHQDDCVTATGAVNEHAEQL